MAKFFILILSLLFTTIHSKKIHEQMTAEEVHTLFRTKHDDVPEYEVVPVAHAIHENSLGEEAPHRILQLKSFKRDIKLYLEPTEGLLAGKETPVWKARGDRRSPLGIKYTKEHFNMRDVHYLYQDRYNLAAFCSTYDEHGEVLFDGTIGDDLVVRPLPARLRKDFSRAKRSSSFYDDEDFPLSNRTVYHPNLRQTYHHVVFKKKELPADGMREKIGSYQIKDGATRSKRSTKNVIPAPKTVYPQILVVVDHSHYLSLQSIDEVKRYVISFWNAVDLRYRVFVNPEVRLNIAGIVISMNWNGTPYLQKHRSRPVDGPVVDADKALDDMAMYYFNETMDDSLHRFVLEKDYDMVMTMTSLDLCNLEPADKDFDCTTLGFAFRGGACTMNIRTKMIEAVGLVEDNGGYIGILPAAHEVGHLLGSPHDGHEQDDKTTCPAYSGYIMSSQLMLTDNVFTWSSCTMEYFEEFFHSRKAECLFDMPNKGKPVTRILPGQVLSLDEQCDRIKGTYACNHNETACRHLDCFIPNSGDQCLPVAPAAEGSTCGKGNYCINGKCVNKKISEIELEIAPPPLTYEPPFWGIDFGDILVEKS